MVGEVINWQMIFRKDLEKTNKLQKKYKNLIKKFNELEKQTITEEQQNQINHLIDDIKSNFERIEEIDSKQTKILSNYCGFNSLKYLT